jgi:hypothetical protein
VYGYYVTIHLLVPLPLIYFRFNYVAVFAFISVSVNEIAAFPLMGISVVVNGKNTGESGDIPCNRVR